MRPNLPLVFILITLAIDAMGIGLMLPVMPALLQEIDGGSLADAAIWGGILTTTFATMQFLCGPTLGSLSDRFGRRPVLLVSLTVVMCEYLVMATAGSILILLAARVAGGIASATQAVGYAFIADISKPEEKAARFGLIGASFGVGFVLGPVIGGLLGELGTRAPFYAAAALAAANLAFGFFVLPETLKKSNRRDFRWARANPLGSFAALSRLPGVTKLVMMFLFYQVAFNVYPAIWAYFTRARFGWDSAMVGLSLAAFGIALVAVQGGLIRIILRRLGDRGTVLYGLAFNMAAFLAMALVSSGTVAIILTPLTALGAVVTPAVQGMMSRIVGDDAQGELQGVLSSAHSLALIVSPPLMTATFAAFTNPEAPLVLPGAPFLVSMALMVVCWIVFTSRRAASAS